MAAVAAEPGAAVPTQTRPESPPEPEPFEPAEPRGGPESVPESGAEPGAGGRPRSAERGEGRHVGPEQPGAGPVLPGPNRTAEEPPDRTAAPGLSDPPPTDCGGSDRVQPGLPNPEPQPPAVFLHSVPDPVLDPAPVSEAGLSLAEPAEPTETTEPDRYSVLEQQRSGSERKERSGSEPSSVLDLSPGTEVRVSLEHVIDDALVVSFRRGQREFSGVLMDVSRRFGPYGIPITPFPRRDDGARPSASLQTVAGGDEPSADGEEAAPARPPPCGAKPPPLFQEGAPYPPPLFIRDTYNQALPQPPPRKIKRPKRRYRCEEPTSIMNAIKLRPRQVLCDKCKGVVASAGPREARRGAAERRPADVPMSSELKRLKMDDRSKRSVPAAPASRRVLGGVASPSAPPSGRMRLKLNSKKVLTPGSDRPNARKAAAPERNPDGGKAVTRAAALQKVHFTRLQSPASSAGGTPLPPRMRLKPQRYRTDDPAPCSASESSPAHSPPAPATAPPTPPPPAVAVETSEDRGAPPPSSSSDSSHSETFDPPPSSSSLAPPPAPPPSSAVVSHCPASSSPAPPTADGEEEEDGGGDAKRRRKLSTSSSSSSSSSSSVFSKSVSKCLLPDGRTACVGDIVWAKIYGFPWWPARVLGITVARRGDTGLAVQQEARVSWFGSPTTSFLPLAQLSPFLETFQLRFDKKRKGPYRRAIAEAASAAKQLTPEVRALLTQFET